MAMSGFGKQVGPLRRKAPAVSAEAFRGKGGVCIYDE
jgi:hypothetical protein